MITALDVANTFLEKAKADNIELTPMKLQKLLYILYKSYLKQTGYRLFADRFEVWKYGPVISDVYYAFRQYRSNAIRSYYMTTDSNYNTVAFGVNSNFDNVFREVWQKYREISGIYLSQLTHRPNTAWSKADIAGNTFLSDDDIFAEEEYELAV